MSTTTTGAGVELAKRGPRGVVARNEGWSEEEVRLIKATVAADLNPEEFKAFVYVARERHLNPLLKQIYAIKYGGKVTHQTSIDGFRAIAARTKLHAGTDDAVFEGTPSTAGFRATVTVWKLVGGVRCPFVATARWEEYNPGQGLWKKMPHSQLGKCSEALALRKAFPEDLGGLYTADEMAQADVIDVRPTVTSPAIPPAPPSVNPKPAAGVERTARKRKAEPAVAPTPTDHDPLCGCDNCWPPADRVPPPAPDEPRITREQQKLMFAVAKEQKLPMEPDLRLLVRKVAGVESTGDIPKSRFDALLRRIEGKPDAFTAAVEAAP
jgi:phage recombination protein Bet